MVGRLAGRLRPLAYCVGAAALIAAVASETATMTVGALADRLTRPGADRVIRGPLGAAKRAYLGRDAGHAFEAGAHPDPKVAARFTDRWRRSSPEWSELMPGFVGPPRGLAGGGVAPGPGYSSNMR